MKNAVTFSILIVLSLVTIGYSYFQRDKFEDKLWIQNSNLLEARFALSDIKEKEKMAYLTDGVTLCDSVVSLVPSDVYILRLHEGVCMSCYANNVKMLAEVLDSIGKNLFVIGAYTFDSALKEELSFIQTSNIKSINIRELSIMPADSLEIPYIFHLTSQGKIDHLHFFEKHDFSLTRQYILSIQRLFP